MSFILWLNVNAGAITALATVVLAIFTGVLVNVGLAQARAADASAEVAKALREIEKQRDREISVSFVQVPNKNEGGVFEFKTANYTKGAGVTEVKAILIRPDGGVKVEFRDGKWQGYAKFVLWRE